MMWKINRKVDGGVGVGLLSSRLGLKGAEAPTQNGGDDES